MNPSNNPILTGQNAGVSPANPINDPQFNVHQGSNTYDLSFQNLLTARYGEITPFFYYKGVGRDRTELRSSHELRTYTLAAPLMSGLRMRKSQFSVSKKCMMPNTYDLLFVNPVKGDDVPNDAYQSIDMCKLLLAISNAYASLASTDFSLKLKLFLLYSNIVSSGGLPDLLGMSLYNFANMAAAPVDSVSVNDGVSYTDNVVELLMAKLTDIGAAFNVSFNVVNPLTNENYNTELIGDSTLSTTFEICQQIMLHPDCVVSCGNSVLSDVDSFFARVKASRVYEKNELVVNIYKIIAYQMIVAQFYSNDHVDAVYNSDLWLSNMKAIQQAGVVAELLTFEYNGVSVYYDG